MPAFFAAIQVIAWFVGVGAIGYIFGMLTASKLRARRIGNKQEVNG